MGDEHTQGSCQQWYKENFGVDVFSFVSDLHPALDGYQLLLNLCSNMDPCDDERKMCSLYETKCSFVNEIKRVDLG